jgi:hypothetical protein
LKEGTAGRGALFDALDGTDSRRIGTGSIGGKASGLAGIEVALGDSGLDVEFPSFRVMVPSFTVIATEFFDEFMGQNGLYDATELTGSDQQIGSTFIRADLSPKLVGLLWQVSRDARQPLAVRSSSMLEDSLEVPFAGIYQTKMIPNFRSSEESRFKELVDAIKLVYASTFFRAAADYSAAVGVDREDEKMAVIIQEVMGRRFGRRFYPVISGVARSFNYYPFGGAGRKDGVVDLALGLGKTIVDGGDAWSYCPRFPSRPRPFASTEEMLETTQKLFWAVNMSRPAHFDPLRETEFLISLPLDEADYDDVLRLVASTYDPGSDRFFPGTARSGPKIVDFSPVLKDRLIPLNDLVCSLLSICRDYVGSEVEIEFAVDPGIDGGPDRFGFLQVRPMAASFDAVDIDPLPESGRVLVWSSGALGNVERRDISHVLYVKPDSFDKGSTRRIAGEISDVNRQLCSDGIGYVLIGFGRWGSSDPWLGIPVTWGQISGAATIVEIAGARMRVELSQGSHFFHNIIAFGTSYFSIDESRGDRIDWEILGNACTTLLETEFTRCVRLDGAMIIKVDGRSGRGVILHEQ